MSSVYLLKREVSSYTDADLLLGVFLSIERAEAARAEYVARVIGSASDPLASQAYRSVSETDVSILRDVEVLGPPVSESSKVWVVSEYAEGFGELLRKFVALAADKRDAERFVEQQEVLSDEPFPVYWELDELEEGVLRFPTTGTPGRGDGEAAG